MNEETGVEPILPVLSWSSEDPDPENEVYYDLYLSISDPPALRSRGLMEATFYGSRLRCNTTYYWRVVAKDNYGAKTSGPVWSFTTNDARCPVIEGLDPNPCFPQSAVTIRGRNFGSTKGVIKVGAKRYKKHRIISWSDTMIVFRIMPYKKWISGTSHTRIVTVKGATVNSSIRSNRVPLTINKP